MRGGIGQDPRAKGLPRVAEMVAVVEACPAPLVVTSQRADAHQVRKAIDVKQGHRHRIGERVRPRLVPPVVEREGPRGIGSMQLFIAHDPDEHYFAVRAEERLHPQYVRLAAFDLITNNADRKGGHMLLDGGGHVWAIDNALTFHRIEKLRTVIWDFSGERVPDPLLADIERVMRCVSDEAPESQAFRALITSAEVDAFVRRCATLLAEPVLPEMYAWRCVPWPLV